MSPDGKLPVNEGEIRGAAAASAAMRDNIFMASILIGVNSLKTKRMTLNAVLAAMCAVLGAVSLDFGSIKLTLESVPVLIGALLFGPVSGMAIGFVGTLSYQLIRYGVSATTLLWILPYVVCGLVVGLYSKKHEFKLTRLQTVLIVIIAELMVTTLNTGALYIDSRIYGYYYPALIAGMLIPRYAICVVKSLVYGLLLPLLITNLQKLSFYRQAQIKRASR